METRHYFVPYAYDFITDFKDPKNGSGTRVRCDRIIGHFGDILKRSTACAECTFIFSAGYSSDTPNDPRTPEETRFGSLADQMQMYVKKAVDDADLPLPTFLRPESLVWGTLGETIASAKVIRRRAKPGENVIVWVCSNLGHLPRIRLCWNYVGDRSWDVRFLSADKQRFTWKERLLLEPAKFMVYLVAFLLVQKRPSV